MKNKNLVWAGLAAVLVIAVGAYIYPEQKQTSSYASSSVGTTFNSAKIAAITWSPSTGATSTAILNSDSSDRKIESFVADCSNMGVSQTPLTGTGLLSNGLVFSMATTSTNAPAVVSNANILSLPIATTSLDVYNIVGTGTSTPNGLVRVWAAGSYLTFWSNATNTASCVVGVHYLAS